MRHLLFSFPEVPDDVFAPDFIWKGSYDYKGQKQPMTLTVTSFNATTGKVNVTLSDSSVEFLLSGESSINHLSSTSSPPPPVSSSRYLCVSLPFILRVSHVNQSVTKLSRAWEWKLTVGSTDSWMTLLWLTAHSRVTRLLLSAFGCFLTLFIGVFLRCLSFPGIRLASPLCSPDCSSYLGSSTLQGCSSARRLAWCCCCTTWERWPTAPWAGLRTRPGQWTDSWV